jgi:BirA family biotin operon repressor/biotin-[acetyl-CoA-carboxylase] ligase
MLAGLAVCAGLEQVTPVHPLLKWPNDILLAGRKAGGLLLETAFTGPNLSYAVLGIGLNVSYVPDPAEVDFPATSVQAEAGAPVERPALLHAILQQLERRYPHLASAALYADWHARLAWLGQRVTVRALDGDHTGYLEAVTAEGSLCLRTAAGEHLEFLAGDVRLRV